MSEIAVKTEITVKLVSKAEGDLTWLIRHMRLSKTDVVNRAITLYRFVEETRKNGGQILIRSKKGEVREVKLK